MGSLKQAYTAAMSNTKWLLVPLLGVLAVSLLQHVRAHLSSSIVCFVCCTHKLGVPIPFS